jgi:hypothetical protein
MTEAKLELGVPGRDLQLALCDRRFVSLITSFHMGCLVSP